MCLRAVPFISVDWRCCFYLPNKWMTVAATTVRISTEQGAFSVQTVTHAVISTQRRVYWIPIALSSGGYLPCLEWTLIFNPLAPNDLYISRTAQLISRRCILNIYSTNILTETLKRTAHSPGFSLSRCRLFHNAIFFGSCNIHILNIGCAKIFMKIPAPKG